MHYHGKSCVLVICLYLQDAHERVSRAISLHMHFTDTLQMRKDPKNPITFVDIALYSVERYHAPSKSLALRG